MFVKVTHHSQEKHIPKNDKRGVIIEKMLFNMYFGLNGKEFIEKNNTKNKDENILTSHKILLSDNELKWLFIFDNGLSVVKTINPRNMGIFKIRRNQNWRNKMRPSSSLINSFDRMSNELITKNLYNEKFDLKRKIDLNNGNISIVIDVKNNDMALVKEIRSIFDCLETGCSQIGFNVIWSHNVNKEKYFGLWTKLYRELYELIERM